MSYLIPPDLTHLPTPEHCEEVRVKRGYKGKAIGMWNRHTLQSQAADLRVSDEWIESHKCSVCSAQLIHLNNPQWVIPVGHFEGYELNPKDFDDICIAIYSLQSQLTTMNYLQSDPTNAASFKPGDEVSGDKFFYIGKTEKVCYNCVVEHFNKLVSIVKSL